MLWFKAFHIIAMVAWFAGLFYLPRLFVYHAEAQDEISVERFKIMERRLYYAIMWPAAVLTTGLGLWLMMVYIPHDIHTHWMQAKLVLVCILWAYHVRCGFYLQRFQKDMNQHTSRFYRLFNEFPTLMLIGIVILVEVRPF